MPYNFVLDSFHTGVTAEALRAKIDRKSAISHQRGHFDPKKFQVQGGGYVFLLAWIELFLLGVKAEELRAIIGWKSAISLQRGSVNPKVHVERVVPHQPFFFSEN